MKTLSANVNNNIANVAYDDIYLDKLGNISVSFDLQATLEGCAQAAQTVLGEIIFNQNQGIPFFQTVWIGVPNVQQYTAALRIAFLNVPNVVEVVSLLTSQVDNELTYTAVIRTVFGSGGISG